VLLRYPGASDEMKNTGPAMAPTQYTTKFMARTTVRFAKSATFDVTMDRERVRLATVRMPWSYRSRQV
jgi:hypothetical protein